MKKALMYVICAAFLLSAIAFAADQPASTTGAGDLGKVGSVKVAKMYARGKVVEISDKMIKIERRVRDDVETMEFVLDNPVENIGVNDAVKIAYIAKDGNLLASRVVKIIPRKAGKKATFSGKAAIPKK